MMLISLYVPSLDDYGEYGYVRRIHPWDASSLRKCLGTILLELFATLESHGTALIVIQPPWYSNGLVKFCPFCRFFLLLDVWRIMSHNLNFSFKVI